MPSDVSRPILILPNHTLKATAGITGGRLASVITPEMLDRAQKTIDAMADTGMQWVREDFARLEKGYAGIASDPFHALETMKEATLSIKSRAGMFSYALVSQIARQLYLFLAAYFQPGRKAHHLVVQKHLDALKVIFASGIKKCEGIGQELALELQRLIYKHQ